MQMPILLLASHGLAGAVGFAAGIYTLPILIAPPAPSATEVSAASRSAGFPGEFRRDLQDSDALHWGEGKVSIGETEAEFKRLKPSMALVGDVRTFDDFLVPVPPGVEPAEYTSVIVWCETFGEFITSARYR